MGNKPIGIITFPINKNGIPPLSNLVDISSSLCQKTYLITGGEGYHHFHNDQRLAIYNITFTDSRYIQKRLFKYLVIQLQIAKILIKLRHEVSSWIFFIGGSGLIIPLMIAKIIGKKTYLLLAGSEKKGADVAYNFFSLPVKFLISSGYFIVDNIVIYSASLTRTWDLVMYKNKILIAGEHFLDLTTFTVTTPYPDRPSLVGYIGRLSAEKGVQHFAQALPAILSEQQDLRVLIGGDGQLKDSIESSIQDNGLTTKATLPSYMSRKPIWANQDSMIFQNHLVGA